MAFLEVVDTAFSYRDKPVFEGIHFSVDKGEIFCLLGPNGCGKTTLLDCILGTLRPDKGRILLDGMPLCEMAPASRARRIAYVPQGHTHAFPYTVQEMVLFGRAAYLGLFASPGDRDVRKARQALSTVGIDHLQDRPYTALSGGEGQLVLIARALAQETDIIIMDEPTAHLDFKHELLILETIVGLVRDKNITVIMASHFPNQAFYFDNHNVHIEIALFNRGRFLDGGRPEKVLNERNIRALYGINADIITYENGRTRAQKYIIPSHSLPGSGN
jgi:iron complex transport system ATP-binding protein